MRATALLALLAFAVAGCADADEAPDAHDAPEQVAGSPLAYQEFRGSFAAMSPAGCIVDYGVYGQGIVQVNVAVDEASEGQLFEAYVNATGTTVQVAIHFMTDGEVLFDTGGASGELLHGRVPHSDDPIRAHFTACGAGGPITVEYRAGLQSSA